MNEHKELIQMSIAKAKVKKAIDSLSINNKAAVLTAAFADVLEDEELSKGAVFEAESKQEKFTYNMLITAKENDKGVVL